jgi:hypothetical protein
MIPEPARHAPALAVPLAAMQAVLPGARCHDQRLMRTVPFWP